MIESRFFFALLLVLLVLPRSAGAQVVISEFMYDAPGSDTGQEWVELFNAGNSAVDLTKWKISDGSNHILNVPPKNGGVGSISVAPGGYIVLADSAPTFEGLYPAVANVVDTTLALPNTSGAIALVDDSGATVDTFSYTKDMGAAGDGNSLQRASVVGAVFAALPPTPGTGPLTAGNTNTGTSTNDTSSATTSPNQGQTTTTSSSASAPVSSYVPPPLPRLFADAGDDRTVIVGADVEFDGRAYDRTQTLVDGVRFSWNFGDGATAEGQSVLHHFEYPGRYVVVLGVAENKDAASDQFVVTAEPAALSFAALSDGGVAIENRAGRNLDLSDWIVRNIGRVFLVPARSIVLSGAILHISQKILGFWSSAQSELDYPNGALALRAGESSGSTAPSLPPPSPPARAPVAVAISAPAPPAREDSAQVPVPAPAESPDPVTMFPVSSQAAGAAFAAQSSPLWWFVILGFAALASCALIVSRYFRRGEWDIVEDTSE